QIRARIALDVIADAAESLRADAAERRSLLLFSEGHQIAQAEPALNARADVRDVYLRFLEVLRQAALANVVMYTLDPRGLRAPAAGPPVVMAGPGGMQTVSAPGGVLAGELMGSLAA